MPPEATDDTRQERLDALVAGWPDALRRRYAVKELIGEGGMGVVLRAFDRELERPVAIKAVRGAGDGPENAALHARLRREMHLLQELAHDSIVRLYDAVIWPGDELLIMEWVEGHELEVPRPVAWSHAATLAFMARVADGLAHAHARQIIHRDLKPQNVLVTRDGGPKILDLGLARGFGAQERTALTETGSVVGTPAWLPPEILAGEPFSPASDVFQLGLITQDLLAGRLHHGNLDRGLVLSGVMHGMLARGELLPRHLDDGLATLLLGCLALEPDERPSAPSFRRALGPYIDGERPVFPDMGTPIPAPPDRKTLRRRRPAMGAPSTAASPRPAPPRRRRPLALAAGLSALAALVLGLLLTRPSPAPLALSAPRIAASWREIAVSLRTDGPRRLDWSLHGAPDGKALQRGRVREAATEHEIRIRALAPGKDYRLHMRFDGQAAPPLALRTKDVTWPMPPRADRLGDALLLRWEGRGAGPVRWVLNLDGRPRRSGKGEDRGSVLLRPDPPALPMDRWTWELVDATGRRHGPHPAVDCRIPTAPSPDGQPPRSALPAERIRPPILVGDVLVGVDMEGRLWGTSIDEALASTGPCEPSWRSPRPEAPPSRWTYFTPPMADGPDGIMTFRESLGPDRGLRRFVLDGATPGRLLPRGNSQALSPRQNWPLMHMAVGGGVHRLAFADPKTGELLFYVSAHGGDGRPPVRREALLAPPDLLRPIPPPLVDPLLSDGGEGPAERLNLTNKAPDLHGPPPFFRGAHWPLLSLDLKDSPRHGKHLRRAFLLMRYRLDGAEPWLFPLALMASLGPPPGAAVLGERLWIAAGKRLVRVSPEGDAEGLTPDPKHGLWFFGAPFERAGRVHVWAIMGILPESLHGAIARLHHRPRWALTRIDDEGPSPRLRVWAMDRPDAVSDKLNNFPPERWGDEAHELCLVDDTLLVWHGETGELTALRHGLGGRPHRMSVLPGPRGAVLALQNPGACHLRPLAMLGPALAHRRGGPAEPLELPLGRSPLPLR